MNMIELAKQSGMVYREFEDEFANANTDGVIVHDDVPHPVDMDFEDEEKPQ